MFFRFVVAAALAAGIATLPAAGEEEEGGKVPLSLIEHASSGEVFNYWVANPETRRLASGR